MSRTFNGTSDLINCNSASGINELFASPGGTLCAWIYPLTTGEGTLGRIIDKRHTFPGGWNWFVDTVNNAPSLRFLHAFNGNLNNGGWDTATSSLVLKTWQHVATTYDRSSASNTPTMYINASIQTITTTDTPLLTADTDKAAAWVIGNNLATTRTWDGEIAYMQAYTRILTQNEIIQTMWFPGSITRNLAAFWPLFGHSAIEGDYTGNQNRGALTGTVLGIRQPPINGVFAPSEVTAVNG